MDVAVSPVTDPVAGPALAPSRTAARRLLVLTALGVTLGALTFRIFDAGLGWLAADAILVVALLAGVGRGRPGGAAWLLALASVWLAGVTAWHASDWALAIAFPGSLATLAGLGLLSAVRARARDVDVLGTAALDALREVPAGIVDAARLPVAAMGEGLRGHAMGILRGLLVGAPLALVFTGLLAADSRFVHAVGRIFHRSGDGLDFALWTGGATCALMLGYAVLRRTGERRFAPPAVRPPGALVPTPYRIEGDAPGRAAAPVPAGSRVKPLTWSVVLAQLAAVFGIYVVANWGSLFEGHAYLQARGTETYAGYLHEGFTQVSVATLLAVACVVVGHGLLRSRDGDRRIAGGPGLVTIEVTLLALVALTLVSCAHRLGLYEDAYGYTYLRLGVLLLQLGVGGLLALTGARCVARGVRGWGAALAWSSVAFAVLAGSIDADGWIARRNVARARAGAPLDAEYLATLSEDARGVLPDIAALDASVAGELASAWGAQRDMHRRHGWRSTRGLGAR